MTVFTPSRDVSLSNSRLRIAKEPLGTGTLIAFEVNLPSNDGSAFEILCNMIYEHGGDYKKINFNYKNSIDIKSDNDGYLKYTDTKKIGSVINFLTISNGILDNNAGIKFFKKNGDHISKGDAICRIFSDHNQIIKSIPYKIKEAYSITY